MKYPLVFIGLTMLILSSCQQELNFPDEDNFYLGKMVFFIGGGSDSSVYEFSYDGSRRLTGVIRKKYPGAILDLDGKYLYAGRDSVPYKYIEKQPDLNSTTTHFYTYKNGFIVKDSAFSVHTRGQTKAVTTYDSLPNGRCQLRKITTDMATGTSSIYRVTYSRNVSNNSIAKTLDTAFRESGAWNNMDETNYEFDNQKSPFIKWNIWFNGYYSQLFCEARNNLWPGNHSNMTKSSNRSVFNGFGPRDKVIRYDYTYNADGYPITWGNDLDNIKIRFAYIKLGR